MSQGLELAVELRVPSLERHLFPQDPRQDARKESTLCLKDRGRKPVLLSRLHYFGEVHVSGDVLLSGISEHILNRLVFPVSSQCAVPRAPAKKLLTHIAVVNRT